MKKTMVVLGAVALAVGMVLVGGVSAQATDNDEASKPYVYVAWRIDDQSVSQADLDAQNHATIFPQTLAGSWPTDSDAKVQFRNHLDCGTAYQTDVYFNNEVTASLVAGKVLTSAQHPAESHVRDDGSTWDVFRTPRCEVEVSWNFEATPPTCDKDGVLPELVDGDHYTLQYDRDIDGPGKYTITATATGEYVIVGPATQDIVVEGKVGACLASTGVNDVTGWLIPFGVGLFLLGGAGLLLGRRRMVVGK